MTQSLVKSGLSIELQPSPAAAIGANFLNQEKEVIERVLTEPPDRITTGELFLVINDLSQIQDYMCDNMQVMNSKIDLENFVDTQFAEAAGAK